MCGRFLLRASPEAIIRAFEVNERPNLRARYAIRLRGLGPVPTHHPRISPISSVLLSARDAATASATGSSSLWRGGIDASHHFSELQATINYAFAL
jgi:hypothetical protein